MKGNKKYSFERAWEKRIADTAAIKAKIMAVCNITTDASWRQRRRGEVIPRADEKEAIEQIFAEYGITAVWDGSGEEKLELETK